MILLLFNSNLLIVENCNFNRHGRDIFLKIITKLLFIEYNMNRKYIDWRD